MTMSNALELQLVPTAGSLEAYTQWANRVPMLSAEEERALALRFRRENHLPSARQLVLSHLRFVVKVARGYLGYGLPLADLIQEGTIGLMKAVKRFDPGIGVRLVKIATTKAQRKLFFNLRNVRRRLGWMRRDEVRDVANELGVSVREVRE